jgi:hypothetical protein
LVGSSSSSRSGSANSAAASATRMRQPPENSAIGRSRSAVEKPSPLRISAARRRRAIGVDLDQPVIDLGKLFGFGGFQLRR